MRHTKNEVGRSGGMTDMNTKTTGELSVQNREPYWDYMGRRMKEELLVPEETYRNEIAQMQKEIHYLRLRVKKLMEEIHDLKKCGPVQLELDV